MAREPGVLDQLKALDEQRAKLLEGAKNAALEKAKEAIEELNALGFHYRLAEGPALARVLRAKTEGKLRIGNRKMQIARFAIFALILFTIVGPTVFRSARSRLRRKSLKNAAWFASEGFVTLPCRERGVSAPEELSGRCDCGPPRGHRDSAKRAVRLGGDEMALDVEGVVDGGVCGNKLLG